MAGKTTARNILAREREQRAIELRKDGLSYRRIGAALGVSDKAVMKMVRKVITRINNTTDEKAEEIRLIELERLDRMFEAIYPEAQLGDIAAIRVILMIMERRTQYLGLDAPKTQQIDIDVSTDIDEQLARLVERFKSSGQVSAAMGANGSTQPINAPRRLVELVDPGR